MNSLSIETEKNVLNPNSLGFDERKNQLKEEQDIEKEARERAKKSPYKNFVQVNKDAYKVEDWILAKSPKAYRVFKFLVNNMDNYNAVVCSNKVLQDTFGVSKPTITRAIKLLKDKQYIDIYKSGTSNVYAVNKQIVWNSWGTNYDIAKFGANIVLSASEQEIGIQAEIKAMKHKELIVK